MTHPGQSEADALLSGLADRIAERMVGLRKPVRVSGSEVRTYWDGAVTVRLQTDVGVFAVTLRREAG